MALNNSLHQMDLTDTYKTLHPKAAKSTFFSNAHGTFSEIDRMTGHKAIISSIFSDHKSLELETNLKEKSQKK